MYSKNGLSLIHKFGKQKIGLKKILMHMEPSIQIVKLSLKLQC